MSTRGAIGILRRDGHLPDYGTYQRRRVQRRHGTFVLQLPDRADPDRLLLQRDVDVQSSGDVRLRWTVSKPVTRAAFAKHTPSVYDHSSLEESMARKRRSAFVPRVIFSTVFVGVVPAVASCGGDDTSGGGQGGSGGQGGTIMRGVAAGGFGVAGGGVAGGGFAGVGVGGFAGVAAAGFGGSGGNRDAASDAPSGDARDGSGGQDGGRRDAAIFGVAAGGFGVANPAFQVLPKAPESHR
jgi:hypothetical protein